MGRLDFTDGEENSILSLQFNRKIFRRTDNGPPIIIQRLIMILSLVRLRCVGSRDRKLYAVWIVVGIVGIVVSHPIGRQIVVSASKQSQEQTVDISSRRFTSVKDKTANSSRVLFRYDELRKSFQGGMIPREPVQSLLRREETFHENCSFSRSLYYYYRCYDGRINLTTDCTSFLR